MIITVPTFNVSIPVNQIHISMPEFSLGATEGYAHVTMGSEAYPTVKAQRMLIPESVYSKWGTDDQVIVDYVLSELGISITNFSITID